MSTYYYTVASLPMLFYDQDLPLSRESFLDMCERELTMADLHTLRNTSLSEPGSAGGTCPAPRQWRTWERGLRNELVVLRAHRKGLDPEKYLRENPDVFGISGIARDAFDQHSPLMGEDVLDRARWLLLDELETGHYFDLEKLVVYFLKLQILERKALLDREKGAARFETVIETAGI